MTSAEDIMPSGAEMRVEDLEDRLKELKERLPMLIESVEDRALFLRQSGMPGKSAKYEVLLDWLRFQARLK